MVQFNPEFVKTRQGKTMVVLTLTRAEYRRVCELLDDAIDVAEVEAAKKYNSGKRWYTVDEARAKLGLKKPKGSSEPAARTRRRAARAR